jgi:adenine/guanine phosphoribosyltransferase-like PRPP-binding protein
MAKKDLELLKEVINEIVAEEVMKECLDVTRQVDRVTGEVHWILDMNPAGGNDTYGFGFSFKSARTTLAGNNKPGGTFDVKANATLSVNGIFQASTTWSGPFDEMPPFDPPKIGRALKYGHAEVENRDHQTYSSIIAANGLHDKLVAFLAPTAARRCKDMRIDVVTTPESAAPLAAKFGRAIADILGKPFVPNGMLKDMKNAELIDDLPPPYKDNEEKTKELQRDLDRMKRSDHPSLQKHMIGGKRKLVQKWMRPSNSFIDWVKDEEEKTEPTRRETGPAIAVLFVDDIVTQAATAAEVAALTHRLKGIEVAGAIAMIRIQQSGYHKKK